MKRSIKFLLGLTVAFSISNCTEDNVARVLHGLEARLVAYDESHVSRTSFNADTDITLILNLVNKSAGDIEAGAYWDYCSLYQVDEFLLVYRRSTSGVGAESWHPVGRAYVTPIYCATINIPVVVHPNSEVSVCGAKWSSNPGNSPLSAGKYDSAL